MRKRTLIRPKDVGNNAASTENKAEVNSLKSGKPTTSVKASRKEVAGVCKKICKVIQYLILILIIPPFLNYASIQKEVRELIPEKGSLYDVGWGQKMFKLCEGQGPPTVIFESPGGMTSDVWSLIYPQVAKIARVCVYDRAGLGFSERPLTNATEADGTDAKSNYKNKWFPFTVERMADDLYHLMTVSSQEPQPFILVGAELGALVSQFYAQMFEGQVLGMVLINPLSEDLFEQDGGTWLQHWYNYIIPSYQTLQLGAALGITRLALLLGLLYQPMSGAELPEKVEYRQKHLMCHPKHLSSVVDEYHFVNESFSQMKTLRMIKSLPENITVTVINGNYYDEQMPSYLNKAWAKSEQTLLTKHYPKANHIVINGADKHMLYRNPRAIIDPADRKSVV